MATISLAAGSVVIKVPLPQNKASRNNKPPAIAVRLQEREAPARSPTSPVVCARARVAPLAFLSSLLLCYL